MQEVYFSLPDANFPSSRAQNRDFCVRTGNFPLVFAPSEHKIGIFVRFLPSEPSFSGFLSTKSGFLCQNRQFSPGFCSSRAQNRGFCALIQGNMASGSRKARKFLFLHAFKLLLPLGHCRQSTWAPGTGAPGHRETVKPWNCGTLGTVEPWNCGTACGGTAPPNREQYCYAHIGLM